MEQAYFSPQEVADRLGVSVFTIRRYIRTGKLRAVKLEGMYRLSRDDLSAFLKEREIGGQEPGPSGASEPSPPARRRGTNGSAPQSSSAAHTPESS